MCTSYWYRQYVPATGERVGHWPRTRFQGASFRAMGSLPVSGSGGSATRSEDDTGGDDVDPSRLAAWRFAYMGSDVDVDERFAEGEVAAEHAADEHACAGVG